jgi:hypothetical protein
MNLVNPPETIFAFSAVDLAKLPDDYRAALIAAGTTQSDGSLQIPAGQYTALRRQFLSPRAALPTIANLAANFAGAMTNWSKAGFAVVDEPTYKARDAICSACQYWQPAARLGMGKCNAPGCGCTKLKRWIATEKCPQGKWEAVS